MAKKTDLLNDLLAKSFLSSPKPPGISVVIPAPQDQPKQFAGPTMDAPEPGVSDLSSREGDQATPSQALAPSSDSKVASQGASPDFEGVKKTTVSFYATEQAHVDEILDALLKSRRHRGGFSDAVKIALRLCPKTAEDIGRAWEAARAEDKRTQKGKS